MKPMLTFGGKFKPVLSNSSHLVGLTTKTSKLTVTAKWCGILAYKDALNLQKFHVNQHLAGNSKNVLLMLEHHPVYTVGIRSKDYPEWEETRLKALGAEFFRTDRGGLITFHGPGQLVVYPILNLEDFSKSSGVKWYVSALEQTLIKMCREQYSIAAKTSPHTGVWTDEVDEKKLAAIGIHVTDKKVTSHGLALNCSTDLWWFEQIVPCGIVGKGVTSLSKELGRHVRVSEVIRPFCRAFEELFGVEIVFCESLGEKMPVFA